MNSDNWHHEVLHFWFEELSKKDWFMSSESLDNTIKNRFEPTHSQLSKLNDLPTISAGFQALASIIVLDQFSRNMYRGTADAFSSDPLALKFSKQAIERNLHSSMENEQKQFLFMPLMHSEKLEDQELSVSYFTELGLAEHAIEHKALIVEFGRFPHRNVLLGRKSTVDELRYLETGKRFGQ